MDNNLKVDYPVFIILAVFTIFVLSLAFIIGKFSWRHETMEQTEERGYVLCNDKSYFSAAIPDEAGVKQHDNIEENPEELSNHSQKYIPANICQREGQCLLYLLL